MASKLKGIKPEAVTPAKPKILIFGKPKTGKTQTSCDFPKVYYIDVERGADFNEYRKRLAAAGGAYFGPEQGSRDAKALLEEIDALATEDHDYRTVVIDSLSYLVDMLTVNEEERLKKAGIPLAFGNEKKESARFQRQLRNRLEKLDMNVILICHEKDLWAKGEVTGTTFDAMPKWLHDLSFGFRITKFGTGPKALYEATVVATRDQTKFTDGETFEWSYKAFAEHFGRDVIEAKGKKFEPITKTELELLMKLLALLNIPTEEIERMLNKVSADELSELSREHAQKWIKSLQTKLDEVKK